MLLQPLPQTRTFQLVRLFSEAEAVAAAKLGSRSQKSVMTCLTHSSFQVPGEVVNTVFKVRGSRGFQM